MGDGSTANRDTPVPVQGVRNAVAIAAGGGGFSAALLSDSTVMTWGNTLGGALGRAPWDGGYAPGPVPARVPGVNGIRAIAAGGAHMIALTETRTVISWGHDTFGSLGRGNNKTNRPGVVPSLTGVHSIVARDSTCVATLASGRMMTWGGVRPWTRPEGSHDDLSRSPILLWLDGLDQPGPAA